MSRPQKHSLTLLGGHRTSVSLEPDFWTAFREIAGVRGQGINALASEIDLARDPQTGLATAIRLFVLRYYREAGARAGAASAAGTPARPGSGSAPK